MKIYVSEKEKDYYITYGNGYEALELNKREPINIKSLEQHDKELLKEFANQILDIWDYSNSNNMDDLDLQVTRAFELINKGYSSCREEIKEKIQNLLKERGVE